jgi:hypothetical protein
VNTVSIAGGATAAIFAAMTGIGYAQTGWHPATQSDKPMAAPGATSGELRTPRPGQSSTPGMSGAAASDPGVPDTGHTRSVQGTRDVGKSLTKPARKSAKKPVTGAGNVH